MNVELQENETIEELCLHQLKIIQNTSFYRFTSDSILLTRFARAKKNDVVADFCSGSGIVGIHFFALNEEKNIQSITLFEMQEELANMSKKSIALNDLEGFSVENCRLQDIKEKYREKFSLILCNPPYERGGFEKDEYKKAICRKEITLTLSELAKAFSKGLKFGGRVALCHRADRLAEVIYELKKQNLQPKRLQFVYGSKNQPPYLILIEAVKGGKEGIEILPNLINEQGQGGQA